MRIRGTEGSALVITMLLLVVLTALGIYVLGITSPGGGWETPEGANRAAWNAAEAGAYYGIDRLPLLAADRGIPLPNGSTYDVIAAPAGTEPTPGFDEGWMSVLFTVRSAGSSASSRAAVRTVEVGAAFGPVPSGTGY